MSLFVLALYTGVCPSQRTMATESQEDGYEMSTTVTEIKKSDRDMVDSIEKALLDFNGSGKDIGSDTKSMFYCGFMNYSLN